MICPVLWLALLDSVQEDAYIWDFGGGIACVHTEPSSQDDESPLANFVLGHVGAASPGKSFFFH